MIVKFTNKQELTLSKVESQIVKKDIATGEIKKYILIAYTEIDHVLETNSTKYKYLINMNNVNYIEDET